MKADDSIQFKEAMSKEIGSFKKEKTFTLISLKDKPSNRSLIPFVWSFKRKRNPMGELLKHKVRLCIHSRKEVKGVDYWNTYAPIVQATMTRLMLILH